MEVDGKTQAVLQAAWFVMLAPVNGATGLAIVAPKDEIKSWVAAVHD